MNVLGIIAEFNPLHTGHEYLIEKLRRETGADFCIVVMSGDYVQRGEPAFFSKTLRTQAALLSGADLVLELPLSVSTGSAEYFAEGAVSLLDHPGCVTHLGFGSESGDIRGFQLAGKLLSEEPEDYRRLLQSNLKVGMNFPKARYEALSTYLSLPQRSKEDHCGVQDGTAWYPSSLKEPASENSIFSPENLSGILSLLESPNNILGVEYCKALHKMRSSIKPVTVKRLGAGYHDSLTGSDRGCAADNSANFRYASASGLRKAFLSAQNASFSGEADPGEAGITSLMQDYVPAPCRSLYVRALQENRYVTFDQFFLPLYHILQYSDVEILSGYQDITESFAARLLKLFGTCSSMTELCSALKARNLTSAGTGRMLLHILLNLKKEAVEAERQQGLALYARILGFRQEAKPLLSEIDRNADIPLVTKTADASRVLSPLALSQLERTIKASELYRAAMPGARSESEYVQNIIIF